jgi:hypothetical protein
MVRLTESTIVPVFRVSMKLKACVSPEVMVPGKTWPKAPGVAVLVEVGVALLVAVKVSVGVTVDVMVMVCVLVGVWV